MTVSFWPKIGEIMEALASYGNDDIRIVYDIANAYFIGEDFVSGLKTCRERLALVHLSDTTRESIGTIRSAPAPCHLRRCRPRWPRSAIARAPCWRSFRADPDREILASADRLAALGFGPAA